MEAERPATGGTIGCAKEQVPRRISFLGSAPTPNPAHAHNRSNFSAGPLDMEHAITGARYLFRPIKPCGFLGRWRYRGHGSGRTCKFLAVISSLPSFAPNPDKLIELTLSPTDAHPRIAILMSEDLLSPRQTLVNNPNGFTKFFFGLRYMIFIILSASTPLS